MIHFDLIFVYSARYASKLIEWGERAGDIIIQLLKSLPFFTEMHLYLPGNLLTICV